ncbi:MAG: helix-turn-helix domain-containing protein [Propionibacteriaceae bacterium]|jgi:transcriptional regulator with XRE-family HTH domain|nr:helix-turn-helix domain-containing protein [Propionibacteriaceae bacterium]
MVAVESGAAESGRVADSTFDPQARTAFARQVGLRLQRLRLERGLSQEKVAHLAGISAYTYQKFEKGESRPGTPLNPRLFTLLALCQVLGVGVGELWGEEQV